MNAHERSLVKTLCAERRLLSARKAGGPEKMCIIGMVEPPQAAERKRPSASPAASFQRVHSA
jgi:hypothetical protein